MKGGSKQSAYEWATILFKSWEGRYPGCPVFKWNPSVSNVFFQNTQESLLQACGLPSLQKLCLARRTGQIGVGHETDHNRAAGSFNLIHFTLPSLPPVFS